MCTTISLLTNFSLGSSWKLYSDVTRIKSDCLTKWLVSIICFGVYYNVYHHGKMPKGNKDNNKGGTYAEDDDTSHH